MSFCLGRSGCHVLDLPDTALGSKHDTIPLIYHTFRACENELTILEMLSSCHQFFVLCEFGCLSKNDPARLRKFAEMLENSWRAAVPNGAPPRGA